MADARLAVRLGLDQAQQPKSRRIRDRPQGSGQLIGFLLPECSLKQRRACGRGDRRNGLHTMILAQIDIDSNR